MIVIGYCCNFKIVKNLQCKIDWEYMHGHILGHIPLC